MWRATPSGREGRGARCQGTTGATDSLAGAALGDTAEPRATAIGRGHVRSVTGQKAAGEGRRRQLRSSASHRTPSPTAVSTPGALGSAATMHGPRTTVLWVLATPGFEAGNMVHLSILLTFFQEPNYQNNQSTNYVKQTNSGSDYYAFVFYYFPSPCGPLFLIYIHSKKKAILV